MQQNLRDRARLTYIFSSLLSVYLSWQLLGEFASISTLILSDYFLYYRDLNVWTENEIATRNTFQVTLGPQIVS